MERNTNEIRTYIMEDLERFYEEQEEPLSPPLHTAATINDPTIVSAMLEHGANPNVIATSDGMTPLMAAAWNQSEETVRLLLYYGANPNIVDKDKWSPLFHAAYKGNTKIADFLLTYGADPTLKDIYKKTPATKAREAGNIQLYKILSQREKNNAIDHAIRFMREKDYDSLEEWLLEGNEVNFGDEKGNGLLHISIYSKDAKAADLLLSYGANVNRQNSEGNTPLHVAARNSDVELVQLLLNIPTCSVLSKNKSRRTPVEEAGNSEIIKILTTCAQNQALNNVSNTEWHDWITSLNNSIHMKESTLLELAFKSGLKGDMDKKSAKEKLQKAETPEAIGLAFALDYFKITKFPSIVNKYLYDNDNNTELGKYIAACIWFDSGRKNISWAMLDGLASDGFTPACVTLAGIHKLYGIKDIEVYKLYKRAAESDNRKAMLELSKCYYYGHGTNKDLPNSIKWFQKALQYGVSDISYGKQIENLIKKTSIPGGQTKKIISTAEIKQNEVSKKSSPSKTPFSIDPTLKELLIKVEDLPSGKKLKSYHIKPVLKELREYQNYLLKNEDHYPLSLKINLSEIIELLSKKSKNAINRQKLLQLTSDVKSI